MYLFLSFNLHTRLSKYILSSGQARKCEFERKKILTGINLTLLFGLMVVLVLVFSSFIQNNFSPTVTSEQPSNYSYRKF